MIPNPEHPLEIIWAMKSHVCWYQFGVLKVSAWVVISWVHFDRTCHVFLSHLRWDIRYPGSSILICYKHVIFNV